MHHIALALAFASLGWEASKPCDVRIKVLVMEPASQATVRGISVRIQRIDSAERLRVVSVRDGGASAELNPGFWSFEAIADGYWGAPLEASLDEGLREIVLQAWPAGMLRGQLAWAAGVAKIRALSLDIRQPPAPAGQAPLTATTLSCPILNGEWRCSVPATTLDVRLSIPGFVPRYAWGVVVGSREPTLLPPIELRRAASVVGFVRGRDGGAVTDAAVELRSALGLSIADRPQAGGEVSSFVGHTDQRGFFQIVGAPPGDYQLVARHPRLAEGAIAVRLLQDTEAALTEPLELSPPTTLELTVDPPLDPWGKQWSVTLMTASIRASTLARNSLVDENGRWERQGLSPGQYRVFLTSSEDPGVRWASQVVEVTTEVTTHAISVPIVRVQGTVRLGKKPLRATVVFGGSSGAVRVAHSSDEQGLYEGLIPQRNDGEERRWTVSVEATEPAVRRNLRNVPVSAGPTGTATVDIDLPHTSVRGTVIRQDGEPFDGEAIVSVHHANGDEVAQSLLNPGERGEFGFDGFEPGVYQVTAMAYGARSAPVLLTLQEGTEATFLKLRLRAEREITVHVVSQEGHMIPGAGVMATAADRPPYLMTSPRAADERGRSSIRVGEGDRSIGLQVAAGGFAFAIRRLQLPKDGGITVPLERVGGQLRILLPAGRRNELYLLHRGFFTPWAAWAMLRSWTAAHGGAEDDAQIVVPALEPGEYVACLMDLRQVPAAIQGQPPKSCVRGILASAGELTLDMGPLLRGREASD